MVRPSPTPVCSGFPAGSFTQLRPHFQAGRAVGSDDPAGTRRFDLEISDPDIRSLAIYDCVGRNNPSTAISPRRRSSITMCFVVANAS